MVLPTDFYADLCYEASKPKPAPRPQAAGVVPVALKSTAVATSSLTSHAPSLHSASASSPPPAFSAASVRSTQFSSAASSATIAQSSTLSGDATQLGLKELQVVYRRYQQLQLNHTALQEENIRLRNERAGRSPILPAASSATFVPPSTPSVDVTQLSKEVLLGVNKRYQELQVTHEALRKENLSLQQMLTDRADRAANRATPEPTVAESRAVLNDPLTSGRGSAFNSRPRDEEDNPITAFWKLPLAQKVLLVGALYAWSRYIGSDSVPAAVASRPQASLAGRVALTLGAIAVTATATAAVGAYVVLKPRVDQLQSWFGMAKTMFKTFL